MKGKLRREGRMSGKVAEREGRQKGKRIGRRKERGVGMWKKRKEQERSRRR